MGVVDCDKRCTECTSCNDHSLYRLRDILYAIDRKIVQHSENLICQLNWGYSCKEQVDIDKLVSYRNIIESYYKSIKDGYDSCLCPGEIQTIIENTLGIVDISSIHSDERLDLVISDKNLSLWVLNNPYCVSYFEWERHLINACPLIGISVRKVENPCKLIANINVVEKKCKLLTTISVYNIACKLDAKVEVKEKQCKLDYNVLVKEKGCKIDYNKYVKLLECNMTPQVISSFLECGLQIDYNVEKKCPELIIDTDSSLLLCDLDVNVFSESVNDYLLSQYTNDDMSQYEIDKLIESYIDSCEIIKKEINGV